ncbi:hypothetical protein [Marinifilum sp. D737]|uniref:hypothetical protein n=1 Tax=Marinifilum sp. D737 TaxID=2969628 RepID=UPI002274B97B|nr:hypothetical protein [Marinifilum sp. D737]MCY1634834.1 hypothetical protein [Marinifilum sp. D737]
MTSTLGKYEIFLRLFHIFPQILHLNVRLYDIFLRQHHSHMGWNLIHPGKCYSFMR